MHQHFTQTLASHPDWLTIVEFAFQSGRLNQCHSTGRSPPQSCNENTTKPIGCCCRTANTGWACNFPIRTDYPSRTTFFGFYRWPEPVSNTVSSGLPLPAFLSVP